MQRYIILRVHWIVHWTFMSCVCVCVLEPICNKYIRTQCRRRCCCHAKHPELIPSNSSIHFCCCCCAFCYCFPFSFSHYAVQLLLVFFVHLFLADIVLCLEFEMLTKMVVNIRTHTYFLHHAIAFNSAVISARYQHILIVQIYGFTWKYSITFHLCERKFFRLKEVER